MKQHTKPPNEKGRARHAAQMKTNDTASLQTDRIPVNRTVEASGTAA